MTQDTASDKRKHPFIIIDDVVFKRFNLTPFEGWLYVAIVSYVNHEQNVAFPGIAKLASETNMSKRQVMRCIASLETKGLISVERKNRPDSKEKEVNHYTIVDPHSALPQNPTGSDSESLGSAVGSDSESLGVVTDSHNNQIESNQIKDIAATTAPLEVESEKPEQPPAAKQRKPRKRDEILDTLGYYVSDIERGATIPRRTGGYLATIKSDILEVYPDMTGEHLTEIFEWYKPYSPKHAATIVAMIGTYNKARSQVVTVIPTIAPESDIHADPMENVFVPVREEAAAA